MRVWLLDDIMSFYGMGLLFVFFIASLCTYNTVYYLIKMNQISVDYHNSQTLFVMETGSQLFASENMVDQNYSNFILRQYGMNLSCHSNECVLSNDGRSSYIVFKR
jgi:hypothetical protein